jgi:hypothetical protein
MNLSLGCVRLENGRCPFLDGLEELPVTDQAKVLAWAKRLAAHANCAGRRMRSIWTTASLNCGFPCGRGSIARSFSIAGVIV